MGCKLEKLQVPPAWKIGMFSPHSSRSPESRCLEVGSLEGRLQVRDYRWLSNVIKNAGFPHVSALPSLLWALS